MTLGDIGKPTVDQFRGFKKVLLVPFVTSFAQDLKLDSLIDNYWLEVEGQVSNLEARLGSVTQIYLEGAIVGGETELDELIKANPAAVPFIKKALSDGATLRKTEDAESLLEAIDLQRCLMVAQASPKVAQQLAEWLNEARKRRYSAILNNIQDTLPVDAVGVLIISQDHQIQFCDDTKVFYIAPPSLNQIERYVRNLATQVPIKHESSESTDSVPDHQVED